MLIVNMYQMANYCTKMHLFNSKSVKNFGLQCIKTILEFSQNVHQKFPPSNTPISPFLQLPHFTEEKIKILAKTSSNKRVFSNNPTAFQEFLNYSKEERKNALPESEFSNSQIEDIENALESIPIYVKKVEVFVEGFEEILTDDFVTLKITIERKNLHPDQVDIYHLTFRK